MKVFLHCGCLTARATECCVAGSNCLGLLICVCTCQPNHQSRLTLLIFSKPDIPIINWIVGESGVLLNHCCDLLCKRICCWSNSVHLTSPCWQVPGVDLIWVLCVGSLDQDVDGMSFTQTGWCSCPLDHWSEIIMDDGQWWGESVCTLTLLAWCSLDFCVIDVKQLRVLMGHFWNKTDWSSWGLIP